MLSHQLFRFEKSSDLFCLNVFFSPAVQIVVMPNGTRTLTAPKRVSIHFVKCWCRRSSVGMSPQRKVLQIWWTAVEACAAVWAITTVWGLRVAFCLSCLCQSLCLSRFKLFWRGCLPLGRNLWRQNLYWSCTRSIISLLPVWRGCLRLGRNLCNPVLMCCDDTDVVVGRPSVELPERLAFLAILTATTRNCHAILC